MASLWGTVAPRFCVFSRESKRKGKPDPHKSARLQRGNRGGRAGKESGNVVRHWPRDSLRESGRPTAPGGFADDLIGRVCSHGFAVSGYLLASHAEKLFAVPSVPHGARTSVYPGMESRPIYSFGGHKYCLHGVTTCLCLVRSVSRVAAFRAAEALAKNMECPLGHNWPPVLSVF